MGLVVSSWELGVSSWELGVRSWELGVRSWELDKVLLRLWGRGFRGF